MRVVAAAVQVCVGGGGGWVEWVRGSCKGMAAAASSGEAERRVPGWAAANADDCELGWDPAAMAGGGEGERGWL